MNAADWASIGSHPASAWRATDQVCDLVRIPRPSSVVELPALPQRLRGDLSRSAVLVVDMQNDFCHPQGWLASLGVDVSGGAALVPAIDSSLQAFRRAGSLVVWLNWGNRPDRLNLSPCTLHVYDRNGRSVGLGADLPTAPVRPAPVLEKGSWGAAIVDPLTVQPEDVRVDKFRMSGFFDSPLDSILRNAGVQTVFFAGVNADQCVLATLMDANFLGYDTILLEDCTATTSPSFCMDATLYNVRQCFGFTALGSDLVHALG